MKFNILALASAALAFMPEAPTDDPFYAPPANLSDYALGEIIRERPVQSLLPLEYVGGIKQVFYRTNNTNGEPSQTVATLFTPMIPDKNTKLLSYQFWEDSNGANCAPSYSIANSLLAPDGIVAIADFPLWMDFALGNGWYVVVADHEGPRAAFIAGHEEGQAGLDGIRAAIHNFNMPDNVPVALHGYSGGAHATAWIANLAESYAPELNIIGAAYGGTPIDLKTMVQKLDGGKSSGFVGAGFTGVFSAYPQYREAFESHLSEDFVKAMNHINSSNICLKDIISTYPNINFEEHTNFTDIWEFPAVKTIVERESLLANVSSVGVSVPKFPRYIYHSNTDEIVPYEPDHQYVQQQCASGANIQFKIFNGGGHITTEAFGTPSAMLFIKQAFDGKTPQVQCGTPAPGLLEIHSGDLAKQLGEQVANKIHSLNGMDTPFGLIQF